MLTTTFPFLPLLSVWIISFPHGEVFAARRSGDAADEDEFWLESVSRARCASRCLSLHGVEALSTPLQCMEPCKDSWKMKRKSSCLQMCERVFPGNHWACETSCEFLKSVLAEKQGSCPPPEKASGFAAACVESCDRDGECSALKKCCSNDCGHTCQSPQDLYKGTPLKPRKELDFQEVSSGHLEVLWSSRFNVSADPVVYVLERRWNFGIQPSEDTATSWEVVAQTTEQGASLSDTRPGRWYQFRVAAVNTHGTRGFTTPSRHIHSQRDPSNPPAPTAVQMTEMAFGPGRSVSAQISWKVPDDLDVPIHHYKVTWSWTAVGHAISSSVTKRRKMVRENQVELDSMRSNRSYTVEVQAVSYWGQTQLKGPKAVLHFNTQRAQIGAPKTPTGDILDVGTPFYQDGRLQVHLYWQSSTDPSVKFYRVEWGPESCGQNKTKHLQKTRTQENFLNLQGLLFSCKYKVLLQPVSKKNRPPAESISFLTPSCATIQAKSMKPITCPGEAVTSSTQTPVKAVNLTASFQIRANDVSANFTWNLSVTPSNQQLTGYQVTWMEVTAYKEKTPHGQVSESHILPPDVNVLRVSGLNPASVYRLEVRTITAEGEGPAVSRTFQTPGHQSIPKQRTKFRKRHQTKRGLLPPS